MILHVHYKVFQISSSSCVLLRENLMIKHKKYVLSIILLFVPNNLYYSAILALKVKVHKHQIKIFQKLNRVHVYRVENYPLKIVIKKLKLFFHIKIKLTLKISYLRKSKKREWYKNFMISLNTWSLNPLTMLTK